MHINACDIHMSVCALVLGRRQGFVKLGREDGRELKSLAQKGEEKENSQG